MASYLPEVMNFGPTAPQGAVFVSPPVPGLDRGSFAKRIIESHADQA